LLNLTFLIATITIYIITIITSKIKSSSISTNFRTEFSEMIQKESRWTGLARIAIDALHATLWARQAP
jgi:hypothetical protein